MYDPKSRQNDPIHLIHHIRCHARYYAVSTPYTSPYHAKAPRIRREAKDNAIHDAISILLLRHISSLGTAYSTPHATSCDVRYHAVPLGRHIRRHIDAKYDAFSLHILPHISPDAMYHAISLHRLRHTQPPNTPCTTPYRSDALYHAIPRHITPYTYTTPSYTTPYHAMYTPYYSIETP